MERSVDWIRDELGAEEFFEIEVWRIVEGRRAAGAEGVTTDTERYGARFRDVEMLLSATEARGLVRRGARDLGGPSRPTRPSLMPATWRP